MWLLLDPLPDVLARRVARIVVGRACATGCVEFVVFAACCRLCLAVDGALRNLEAQQLQQQRWQMQHAQEMERRVSTHGA
jgi:hypothetical protein